MSRPLLWKICQLVGLTTFFRWLHRDKLTILLYHGVRPSTDHDSVDIRGKHLAADVFEAQVKYLKEHYQILSWTEAIGYLEKQKAFPPYSLCITFDDGYANHARVAAPILEKHGVRAIFYLTTGFLNGQSLWTDRFEKILREIPAPTITITWNDVGKQTYDLSTPEARRLSDAIIRQKLKTLSPEARENVLDQLTHKSSDLGGGTPPLRNALTIKNSIHEPMTWDEAKHLLDAGHEIGSHTVTHPILSTVDADSSKTELVESKHELEERLQYPCLHFAYPNGQAKDFTDETIQQLREAGYVSATTTMNGTVSVGDDLFRLKRISMDATDDPTTFLATVTGLRGWVSRLFS